MKPPADIRATIASRWKRSAAAWLAHPDQVEVDVPLHPPSGTGFLADPTGVASWITSWSSASEATASGVVWEERRVAQFGTHRLPTRWRRHGATAVRAAADSRTREEWGRMETLHRAALEMFHEACEAADTRGRAAEEPAGRVETPAAPERLAAALVRHRARWLQLDDDNARLVLHAAGWFLVNPDSGLRIRQVPLEGMHTKWLAQHQALVRSLIAAIRADGDSGLGLAQPSRFHDVVLLDPALRCAESGERPCLPRAMRLDVHALQDLELHPRAVIICENSETTQVLPDLSGAVALSGDGYALSVLEVPWVQDSPVLYWGDIDTDGLQILDRARNHHQRITSVLMDRATLARFDAMTGHIAPVAPAATTQLTADERALYEDVARLGTRLEQERIELGYAVDVLRRELARVAGA
ncbi:Wadjet anti-phage system protein JetD domain-containing protein [Brachybacterium timonense]|uniref:Wadjet anti-phage system protein JetD domain-containing protein n=1 Tax=Brachybacterium timonense TaxID=2050896 RepID=UPI000D0BA724|nr:Wadjet anti-phage system protein JetD domain-containing protein [Brachybacterium timonense]